MKSVSSSELRAVLASSAFVKCYECESRTRGENVCMDVRLCTSSIYEYQYVSAHSIPHVFEVAIFFEVTKQYDCEFITTNTNMIFEATCLIYDTSLDLWESCTMVFFWDERPSNLYSPRIRIPWTRQFRRPHRTNWKVREDPFLWRCRVDSPRTTSSTSLAFFVRVLCDGREKIRIAPPLSTCWQKWLNYSRVGIRS